MKLTKEDRDLIKDTIKESQKAAHMKTRGIKYVGMVGATILSKKGNKYRGVCFDASCGIGTCAEHGAVCAMLLNGETKIDTIVAVFIKDGEAISPCGRCRELLSQADVENLKTWVIVSNREKVRLKELIPYRWQEYWGHVIKKK